MIDISLVIAAINTPLENGTMPIFSIKFIRKTDGSICTIDKARKHLKNDERPINTPAKRKYNYMENDAISIDDLDENRVITLILSNLIEFNNIQVFH